MKLSVSNIAWESAEDEKMYALMKRYGFTGLEIAPARVFPENPYEMLMEAKKWADDLKKAYGFCIPSIQSIWYGRKENLFRNKKEREFLDDYTKKAIAFAKTVDCKNLVFGCPKNRNMEPGAKESEAILFFQKMGEHAKKRGTVIGIEANPAIYHTNFINNTVSALELLAKVNSDGCRLNLDTGTMIYNQERVDVILGKVGWVSHVHISEPGLYTIQKRKMHKQLAEILRKEHYTGFISVEMGKQAGLFGMEKTMAYVKEVFG